MTVHVLDASFSRPSPAEVTAAGAAGLIGYVSDDAAKRITATEIGDYLAAGLSVGLVWEDGAQRAAQGTAAGVQDASKANGLADELGWPADCAIFFAVDFDATASAVIGYFRGLQASRRPVGVYGGLAVVDGMLAGSLAKFGWQTLAWSDGRVSTRAHLYQSQIGETFDVNEVLNPAWGQLAPTQQAVPASTPEVPDMDQAQIDQLAAIAAAVTPLTEIRERVEAIHAQNFQGGDLAWADSRANFIVAQVAAARDQTIQAAQAATASLSLTAPAIALSDADIARIVAAVTPAVAEAIAPAVAQAVIGSLITHLTGGSPA